MSAKKHGKDPKSVPTTGHSWDGIEEYDNPMPRWWLWTFYICIIWGIGYTIAYPAWPMISSATQGLLGYKYRDELSTEIARQAEKNAPVVARLVSTDLNAIDKDPELASFAANAGRAIFLNNCAQCHGAGAAGVQNLGYPNLLDDDWLWGGDMEAIHHTVTHGIRNTVSDEARYSEMPKFGVDGLLEKQQIGEVVEYVLKISGQEHDAGLAAAGATVFAENCASCHGEDGRGDREQGAPNLTDAVWLYGGSREAVTESVTKARFGVMPAWGPRLSEADIRAVSYYVHGLGGGE